MVTLKSWMRSERLSDSDMADRIGGISKHGVRKIRFGVRGPSVRVAARIEIITRGQVRSPDMVRVNRRARVLGMKAVSR